MPQPQRVELTLHDFRIRFEGEGEKLHRCWQNLLAGWPVPTGNGGSSHGADLAIHLQSAPSLPALPSSSPTFIDPAHNVDEIGPLSVYRQTNDKLLLHFRGAALVEVALRAHEDKSAAGINGTITTKALALGLFDDIIMTSLAPLLRRRGYFLIHAFAAVKNSRAVIFVGATGNGKTTSGLSLLLEGWRLLCNDALLLRAGRDAILALPTPGSLNIREGITQFLPRLDEILKGMKIERGKYVATPPLLLGGRWSDPAPVDRIFFPQIDGRTNTAVTPLGKAVCLARLMAESVDRWDEPMLQEHFTLLESLSQQATPYALHLGTDIAALPALLKRLP